MEGERSKRFDKWSELYLRWSALPFTRSTNIASQSATWRSVLRSWMRYRASKCHRSDNVPRIESSRRSRIPRSHLWAWCSCLCISSIKLCRAGSTDSSTECAPRWHPGSRLVPRRHPHLQQRDMGSRSNQVSSRTNEPSEGQLTFHLIYKAARCRAYGAKDLSLGVDELGLTTLLYLLHSMIIVVVYFKLYSFMNFKNIQI